MSDRMFRRTCPASPSCTWRGLVVRASDHGLDSRDDGLDQHLDAVHGDLSPDVVLWDAWEPVARDPEHLLRAFVAGAGLVLLGLLSLHAQGAL